MTTTISSSSDDWEPLLVDGWSEARTSRNVLHAIVGANDYAVVLRPAFLRSGTGKVLIEDEAEALALADALAAGEVMTIESDERESIDMTFVAGTVRRTLDDATRDVWWVEFDYQEISA